MPCLAVRSPSARAALSSVITTLADLAVVLVCTSAVDIAITIAVTIAVTSVLSVSFISMVVVISRNIHQCLRHAFRVDLKPRCR